MCRLPAAAARECLPTNIAFRRHISPCAATKLERGASHASISTQPKLKTLWRYRCKETEGHNVSKIAWNKADPDIIAVAYSEFDFPNPKAGIAACWSLKNPEACAAFDISCCSR